MTNNPLKSIISRLIIKPYKVLDAIYYIANSKSQLEVVFDDGVCFDFSDQRYVHLGDILFYIPLILYFRSRASVYIVCNGVQKSVLKYFFSESYQGLNFIDQVPPNIAVITSPYLVVKYLKFKIIENPVFGVGLAASIPDLPYPLYLARNFLQTIEKMDEYPSLIQEYNDFINNFRSKNIDFSLINNLPIDIPAVFFSPYISSGKFRDIFKIKLRILIRIAESIFSRGITVCLIGTRFDSPIVGFSLVDLRGVDILTLLNYARSPNIIYGFGFDNFWMHYFDIIDKPYNVYFRGRFTNKAKSIHYQSINIAFNSKGCRAYLNDRIS